MKKKVRIVLNLNNNSISRTTRYEVRILRPRTEKYIAFILFSNGYLPGWLLINQNMIMNSQRIWNALILVLYLPDIPVCHIIVHYSMTKRSFLFLICLCIFYMLIHIMCEIHILSCNVQLLATTQSKIA